MIDAVLFVGKWWLFLAAGGASLYAVGVVIDRELKRRVRDALADNVVDLRLERAVRSHPSNVRRVAR